ncbi:MAG: FAD-dependent monooxygenase, partial [Candidatus Eremiobacterota bacterium]
PQTITDYSFLSKYTRFPFITVLPQARFLEFVVEEAARCPNFQLLRGANVREFLEEDGSVRGVRYQRNGSMEELPADLVVGADGRFSRTRHLSRLRMVKTAPPMDVLWFKLPRRTGEFPDLNLSVWVGRGHYLALTDRFDHWQAAMVVPKGASKGIKAAGLENLQRIVAEAVPELADRVHTLDDWSRVSVLQVSSERLTRWYRPGLLLIGDAAHTMSSVGGVGINCAIQDAAVASNVLGRPLREGTLLLRHLREVQLRQEIPIRVTQALQWLAQRQVIARALDPNRTFTLPLSLRIPVLRRLAAWIGAFGVWKVRVDRSGFQPLSAPQVLQ